MTIEPMEIITSAIRPGDVVITHRMRVLVEGRHMTWEGNCGPVYCWPDARVIAGVNPVVGAGTGMDVACWAIQGNDSVWWSVDRPIDPHTCPLCGRDLKREGHPIAHQTDQGDECQFRQGE